MGSMRRRLLWILTALLLTGAGYTAGFLLAPPSHTAVSRTLPEAPAEAPVPHMPYTPVERADSV